MRKIPRPYTDPSYLFRHGGGGTPRDGVLDFSASINPLGPPPSVLRALREALPDIAHYPDPHCRELTARLAEHHHVAPEQIVVGNGSNELIYAIARAFQPRRVAIAEPTYTEYLRASLRVGAAVDHWLAEGANFKLTPFDPEGADLVWLCNPNNPTGALWAGAEYLARWMATHPRSVFVVDEAFLDLVTYSLVCARGFPPSLIGKLQQRSNVIVLRSLTKFYALPGLRLGYVVTRPEFAERCRAELPPWSVNRLAQQAGIAALNDRDYWSRTADWFTNEDTSTAGSGSRSFAACLGNVSPFLRPLPSQTNFVLLRLRKVTADWLTQRLAERGIVVRDASNFVGLDRSYIRVARRTPSENARLCEELKSILAEVRKTCPAP